MKYILLIFSLLSISFANGQAQRVYPYITKIDSSGSTGDTTFAKLFTYRNDTLEKESTAFLFPTFCRVPRYRFLMNVYRKKVPVFRILRHGRTIEYNPDGSKKVTEYNYGEVVATHFFNSANKKINEEDYAPKRLQIGPCARLSGEYIIRSVKKK